MFNISIFFLQRFFPSEFGQDVDRVSAVEPAKSAFAAKAQFRRAVEAAGVPFTYVACNFFAGYFLPTLAQPGATAPPGDKAVILGDGTPKGIKCKFNFAVLNHYVELNIYTCYKAY